MTDFTLHTPESAPEGSQPFLENSLNGFGFIPNLHAVMAESPATLEAYQTIGGLFSRSSLNAVEQNVVWLTINVEHNCHYCVPAHTGIAHMQNVPEDVISALRENRELPDAKLEALRQFTLSSLRNRGVVEKAEVEVFLAAGYTRANLLDVVLGLSHKVLSNYLNHFADTPVDERFQQFDWTPREPVAAE
ncbi:carboxymuconolactone decarboxylase family protein [Maricaulis sp. MIT060901]|uniref:carboxymuconolactone decarboxylase family protein n=1 Tax=Maricaulis sp. MIT060901 TaxID=3096993 RepID=UPI00399AD2A1